MKFMKQKAVGVLMILAGVIFVLAGFSGVTGFFILEGLKNFVGDKIGFVIGLVLVGGGIGIFLLADERVLALLRNYQTRQEARNVANKKRMIDEYRFQEATGYSSDDSNAWVTFYHAYPRNREFKRGRIDEKLAEKGFYLADSSREAIDVVSRMNALELRDISIMEVKIAKNIVNGILKRSGDYEMIPKKKIKNANRLIEKGFIHLNEI